VFIADADAETVEEVVQWARSSHSKTTRSMLQSWPPSTHNAFRDWRRKSWSISRTPTLITPLRYRKRAATEERGRLLMAAERHMMLKH
jgi:hypothetical protein